MAYIRRPRPGADWAATVYTPAGRITKSHQLKSVISRWADDQETQVRGGDWIDPRLAEVTVGTWWKRAKDGRGHLELASRKRDMSHWRCHVEPRWGRIPLGSILKPDISSWVEEMRRSHRADCRSEKLCPGCKVRPATIHGSVNVLRSLLEVAVDARVLRSNPARGVRLPRLPKHVDRILDADEEQQLLGRLDALFPGRADARLFVELLLDSGARWEEAAALRRERFDLRRGRFEIAAVMEANGAIRPYAKTEAGNRPAAVSLELLARLRPVVMATKPGALVFTAPKGGRLVYTNWLRRVWARALTVDAPTPAPKVPGRPGPAPRAPQVAYLDDPQPTPHDCRHTYGTRLADEGVPQHDIAKLMGHADPRSTQRYIHSGDDRFDRAREALERVRGGGQKKAVDTHTTHDHGCRSTKAGP